MNLSKWSIAIAAPLAIMLFAANGFAKDWYVAEGNRGDGSKANPFDDIQRAIGKAVAGDVIHITQGKYHGKMRVGYVVIDKRGLTLVGGYKDKTFAERNPFKYPTTVAKFEGGKMKESFDYGELRTHMSTNITDHQSTVIDGFWFDRKPKNKYIGLNEPPSKCPGCLTGVPIGSHTKPIIWFEKPDCHIRNSVFMNTALYAIRMSGDGSSFTNNLVLNTNYIGLDIYGKNDRITKGPFWQFTIKNNTFVSAWNATSLEGGAGSFIAHSGNADLFIEKNIFHLTNGNKASMGYAIKDLRNFKGDEWVHLKNNAFSQIRGGFVFLYMTDLTASVALDYLDDLQDTPWEAEGNIEGNPFYKFDKTWLERYSKAIPKMDPKNIKVKMDDFNKMRSMLGLPLQAGKQNMGGQFLGIWYPEEDVKKGTFWKPSNAKLKGYGLNAAGPFPIKRAALVESGKVGGGGGDAGGGGEAVARDYKDTDWATILANGDTMVGQAVSFTAYYQGWDTSYAAGFGKKAKTYMDGADKKTHKILKLRGIEEMERGVYPIKGYIKLGSAAEAYLKKKAKRTCSGKKECSMSFVAKGVIKKAGGKVGMGKGPQIVIDLDTIGRN